MLRWHIHLPRDLAAVCLPVLACFCLGLLIGRAEADQPQDKDIIKVFPLKNATAADVAKVLSEVYRDRVAPKGPMVLTVDDKANSLVVKAPAEQLMDIAKLLPELDVPTDRPAAKEALQDVQVRVFWFINASKDEVAPKVATQFQAVAADLKAAGAGPANFVFAGDGANDVRPSLRSAGPLRYGGPWPFRSKRPAHGGGRQSPFASKHALAADPQARPASSLKTTIQITPGRMTILGTMPTETTVSAFAVLVTPKAAGKKVAFAIPEGDWSKVLNWLSDEVGLPLIAVNMPKGKVQIKKGAFDHKPTVTEIIDVLNDALVPQKLMIIRRLASITVWSADEMLDTTGLMRGVQNLKDLEDVGKFEFVRASITLKNLKAEKVASSIKKLCGPFGQVIPMEEVNRLIVVDTGANMRGILKLIEELDAPKSK